MDRISEISEATMALILKNYFIVLALAGLILAFALYVYLYRRPLLSEYFAEKKETAEQKATETAPATA